MDTSSSAKPSTYLILCIVQSLPHNSTANVYGQMTAAITLVDRCDTGKQIIILGNRVIRLMVTLVDSVRSNVKDLREELQASIPGLGRENHCNVEKLRMGPEIEQSRVS